MALRVSRVSKVVSGLFRKSKDLSWSVRGMKDGVGEEAKILEWLRQAGVGAVACHGFVPISPSLVDPSALYSRSLGANSDVVHKEMFEVSPMRAIGSEESLVLRPEGTAGVVRALAAASSLQAESKVWYCGPMFRHERPQKGRWRQFNQFGLEWIHPGVSTGTDAEAIVAALDWISTLLPLPWTQVLRLKVNSLGDAQSRQDHYRALQEHFSQANISEGLSAPSQERLASGSLLRLLDSSHPQDAAAIASAPSLHDFYTNEAQESWREFKKALDTLGVEYEMDPTLVRGLDYYTGPVWELVESPQNSSESVLGRSQATVVAGGRYDGLAESLGLNARNFTGLGWAAGMDRLALLVSEPKSPAYRVDKPWESGMGLDSVGVITVVDKEDGVETVRTLNELSLRARADIRAQGLVARGVLGGDKTSWRKQVKKLRAGSVHDDVATVWIGAEEMESGTATVKITHPDEETVSVPFDAIGQFMLGKKLSKELK